MHWAKADGFVLESSRWIAQSGLPSAVYNLACCTGADEGLVASTIAEIRSAGTPTTLIVGGEALAQVQDAVDDGWVCVGGMPVMRLGLDTAGQLLADAGPLRPGEVVGAATSADLPALRAVVASTYGTPIEWACQAVPDHAAVEQSEAGVVRPGPAAMYLAEAGVVRSAVLVVRVEDTLVGWWMATPSAQRSQGYGRRLLAHGLGLAGTSGVREVVSLASAAGRRLYEHYGFEVTDHLQQWSRPRWAMVGR